MSEWSGGTGKDKLASSCSGLNIKQAYDMVKNCGGFTNSSHMTIPPLSLPLFAS